MFPVRSETIHEPETDRFSGPADPCDSVTNELDFDPSVSKTRKRRRLLHKSTVSARFSLDDCDEDDDTSAQADCFMPAFAETFDVKRTVVGTVCSTCSEGDSLPAAMESTGQSDEIEFEGHEHIVQLLEKRGASARLPAVFETDDTTTESCQQGKCLGLSTVADVQRNSSSLGKGQRRNLSSMTKVLSMIFAAAQFVDSSCADRWNRAARFGRPDLPEACANSDSPLVDAVESAGGEGLRASFWDYQARTRTSLRVLFSEETKTRTVFVTLSSFWSIITTCVSHSARDCRCLFESASTWLPRPFCTTTQFGQLEPEFLARHDRKDAEGSRDSQGSLLNQSWQILTTSPDFRRVLNHRTCDQRHKHGRLPDHFSAFPLQFPQSLCQTLAKQFLVKGSWNSALGILEQLHPDDDERPFDPSASSGENPAGLDAAPSDMDIVRDVDMPPPEPPVVEASPTASERKEITNWLRKIHQQIGHRDNRTLVILLKQRGTHPWFLRMAHDHRCSACEESKPPAPCHITSSYENVPGAILEIDGMHWQHPVTGRYARCQFMVDVGSRAPMVTVFAETRERSNRNNQTTECKESLLKDWFVHRGRPRLFRIDPDGCYMSNEMLDTLHHDLGLNTEVIPGEAPWKFSITGVIIRLVKRTAHIYALDQGRDASRCRDPRSRATSRCANCSSSTVDSTQNPRKTWIRSGTRKKRQTSNRVTRRR